MIPSHENISFPYQTTKIALNNSGNESITLTDASSVVIDIESYDGTQHENIVISLGPVDESCESSTVSQDNSSTGETSTGVTDTGS
jgi:hypothetical protein